MDPNEQPEPTLPPAEQVSPSVSVTGNHPSVLGKHADAFLPLDAPEAPGHAEPDQRDQHSSEQPISLPNPCAAEAIAIQPGPSRNTQ